MSGPQARGVTWDDCWRACASEHARAEVWRDLHLADRKPDLAAGADRRAAVWGKLADLLDLIITTKAVQDAIRAAAIERKGDG